MVNVSFTYELHLLFFLSLDPSDEPVYEIPPAKYTAEHIIKILLNPDESRVCCQKPISVTKSATYVVDVRKLPNQDDIKKDKFGIWKYSGSHPQAFKVYKWEDAHITVEKCSLSVSGPNVVFLRRLHCTHPSNLDFKRLICFLSGRLIYMVVMLIYMVVSCVPAQLHLPYVEYSIGELDITWTNSKELSSTAEAMYSMQGIN